jgi:jumonji domain-containing protein 2
MESKEFTLQRPIEQTLTGKQGFFQALQLVRKKMSLQEDYAPLAKDSQNQPKNEDVEREFWRSNHLQAPIYGADCEATLCDSDTKVGPDTSLPYTSPTNFLAVPGWNIDWLFIRCMATLQCGELMAEDLLYVQTWNISQLDSLLSRVLKDKIPGVNTSYLYFGMWRTFFA